MTQHKQFKMTLFSITDEGATIQQRIYFRNIDKIFNVATEFRKALYRNAFYWKPTGKDILTDLPRPAPGNVRHHVAYDFKRPEAFIVEITRSMHGHIHLPKGCRHGLKYGYSLID